MPDADHLIFPLALVPLIAEVEAMIAAGKGWSAECDKRAEEVSIALFGITEADTHPPEPRADQFYPADRRSGRMDQAAADRAYAAWEEAVARYDMPSSLKASYQEIG